MAAPLMGGETGTLLEGEPSSLLGDWTGDRVASFATLLHSAGGRTVRMCNILCASSVAICCSDRARAKRKVSCTFSPSFERIAPGRVDFCHVIHFMSTAARTLRLSLVLSVWMSAWPGIRLTNTVPCFGCAAEGTVCIGHEYNVWLGM